MSVIQSSKYNVNLQTIRDYVCTNSRLINTDNTKDLGDIIYNLQHLQHANSVDILKRYTVRIIRQLHAVIIDDAIYIYIVEALIENIEEFRRTEILMREHGKDVFGEELE